MNEKIIFREKDTLVLLLHTSDYPQKSGWNPLPQANNNVRELKKLFTDKNIFGISEKNILSIDNKTYEQVYDIIERIFNSDEIIQFKNLIFYFVGHAWKKEGRKYSQLFLTCTNSIKEKSEKSIRFSEVMDFINEASNLQQKIFILDCCFSGEAYKFLGKRKNIYSNVQWEQETIKGIYLAAASSDEEPAGAGKNFQYNYTDFTGEIIKLFSKGILKPTEIVYSDDFERVLKESNKLDFEPFFKNNLFSAKSKEKNISFPFFYNSTFNLDKIKQLLLSDDIETFKIAQEIFKEYLSLKPIMDLDSDKDKIHEIAKIIINKEFNLSSL